MKTERMSVCVCVREREREREGRETETETETHRERERERERAYRICEITLSGLAPILSSLLMNAIHGTR